MISWIITVIAIIIGMATLIRGIISKHFDKGFIIGMGILILAFPIVAISVSAYQNKLELPEEYKYITTTIRETQALISNEKLNLADIEMHRQLADLIKERNELLLKVNINNRSPFAYYKIVLD